MEILIHFLSFFQRKVFKKSKIAQIYYYDPQSAGINLQSPQSDSTSWTLTLEGALTIIESLLTYKPKNNFHLDLGSDCHLDHFLQKYRFLISYFTKQAKFEDDHVFQDEELPKVYYRLDGHDAIWWILLWLLFEIFVLKVFRQISILGTKEQNIRKIKDTILQQLLEYTYQKCFYFFFSDSLHIAMVPKIEIRSKNSFGKIPKSSSYCEKVTTI